jgi:flagellar basal body-associated protein FliL
MKRSEWISEKLGSLPEWVQIIIALAVMIVIAYLVAYQVLFTASATDASDPSERPEIYILQEFDYQTMDGGGTTFVLDYAMDGEVQAEALFPTAKQRDAFRAYLDEYGQIVSSK